MKKQFYYLWMLCLLVSGIAHAQVGIGTQNPDPAAALDIVAGDKGVLIPRLVLKDVNDPSPVSNTARGLLVFNINAGVTGGNGAGFYYWSGQESAPPNRWIFLGTDKKGIIDTLLIDKTFRDSVMLGLKRYSESVEKRGFIELYNRSGDVVKSADSSVLNHFKIGVNSAVFRDSVTTVMQDSLNSERIRDTLLSIVKTAPGGLRGKVVIVTDQDYTVKREDDVIVIEKMTAPHKITLPAAAASTNRMLLISQFSPGQKLSFNVPVHYSDDVESSELLSTFSGGETGGALNALIVSDGKTWLVAGSNF